MGVSALRLAAVPLAVALLLPSLPASPSAEAPPVGKPVAPLLKFQERYREKLVSYKEDGDVWTELAAFETFKIKAVLPIDRAIADVNAFDEETLVYFDLGDLQFEAYLSDDPSWRPGKRSARFVFDEEEVYSKNGEDSHYKARGVALFKWTEDRLKVSIQLKPYADPFGWFDSGTYIMASLWSNFVDASDPYAEEEVERPTPEFEAELPGGAAFYVGFAGGRFEAPYAGIGTVKTVVVGPEEEAEEFYLNDVRLKGTGTLPAYADDGVDPALSIDMFEVELDGEGTAIGVYLEGTCYDLGVGLYAVVACVNGGPPQPVWMPSGGGGEDDEEDGASFALSLVPEFVPSEEEEYFGTYLDFDAPSGEVVITVFDLGHRTKSVTIPY